MIETLPTPCDLDVADYWGRLVGCIPVYMEGYGDVTEVILTDRPSQYDRRPIQYVMEQIASYTGCNLTALRRNYGVLIRKKRHVPLPLAPNILLMPFKCRTPRVPSDSATGYVVYQQVEDVMDAGRGDSLILLTNGREVRCLQSLQSLEEQMCNAGIVEMQYYVRMLGYEHLLPSHARWKKKRRERSAHQLPVLVHRGVEGIPSCQVCPSVCSVCQQGE
jgi:hypothetical protein